MTYVIEVLRHEHQNIEKLLQVLEQELRVFDRGDRPDYEVIVLVFDYFQDYPDSCHHPKEGMIFDKLKSRDPAAAGRMRNLHAEHEEEASRLQRAAQAVERVLGDEDFIRETVSEIVRDFVAHEREHMKMEEQTFFPTALRVLQPTDWADIALKLADRCDPLKGPDLERKFALLRRKILEMEAEAAAERLN